MATALIIDQRDAARASMRGVLESSAVPVRVVEAADGPAAMSLVLGGGIDVAIAALADDAATGNARFDAIAWVRELRAHREPEVLPVVLVLPNAEHPAREAGLGAGANDYLFEPYTRSELLARLQVQLRLKMLQDELRRATEQQRRLGLHDGLTGLANRRHFLQSARRELARSRRHAFSMTIVVIDVDGFHLVNDRAGHLIGDAIITELAAVIRRDLRSHDLEARLGGARFGAVMPQTDLQQSRIVGARLCESIVNTAFAGQPAGSIHASIGIAVYPGGHLESVDELLNACEASAERAAFKGGNRVEVWSEG